MEKLMPFGLPNQGVFVALKASQRNCNFTRSVMGKFLNMEKSTRRSPGLRSVLYPVLPRWQRSGRLAIWQVTWERGRVVPELAIGFAELRIPNHIRANLTVREGKLAGALANREWEAGGEAQDAVQLPAADNVLGGTA